MGRKRIIFITFYMYLKDEEEGTGTLTGHDKRKQCAACFALSFSPSLFLAYRVFPPPAGAVYCVCGLRAENHMLFVLFFCCCCFPCYSYNMLEANTGDARQQIVYNYLQVVFLSKYQQSMEQSNKSKWQHNFSLENAYKNM